MFEKSIEESEKTESLRIFAQEYQKYLERFLFADSGERTLQEAYDRLTALMDESIAEAGTILEVHNRALQNALNIRFNNEKVEWLYIKRANEFLTQTMVAMDVFVLSLREDLRRDQLTHLANRLYLRQELSRLLLEAGEKGFTVGVVMVDIDDFKAVNDIYGHDEGDRVLVALAQIMRESLREGDFVARWGGEEFVLVLPKTDYERVKIPLERLQKAVAEKLRLPDGRSVTLSMGVVVFPEEGVQSAEELVRLADLAMYAAKRRGKNCVVLYPETRGGN
jgi:diguanylate cyclase (GGDEF)-like protein